MVRPKKTKWDYTKYKNKEWLQNEYIEEDKTIREISAEFHIPYSTINDWLNIFGIPKRREWSTKSKDFIITKFGYKKLYKPKCISSDSKGYVFEHRYIMEKFLGRSLTSKERIHHIDGNCLNNNIENLVLCNNNKTHQKIHSSMYSIVYEGILNGLIMFNRNNNSYEFS